MLYGDPLAAAQSGEKTLSGPQASREERLFGSGQQSARFPPLVVHPIH